MIGAENSNDIIQIVNPSLNLLKADFTLNHRLYNKLEVLLCCEILLCMSFAARHRRKIR